MRSHSSAGTAGLVAAAAAAAALGVGLAWGTRVAGGSDSYCYLAQTEGFADGSLFRPLEVGFTPPWTQPALSLAPTGFIPAPARPGAIAPICPAGYSLAMVPFRLVAGRWAMHLVVPLLGCVAVWTCWRLGTRLAGPQAGALAAVWLATSPVLLYQIVQPMSDVPAAGWWSLAAWLVVRNSRVSLAGAGLATAAAVLTRPNLVPVAIVLLGAILARPGRSAWRGRLRDASWFCAGGAPGAVAAIVLQTMLYGSAASSGYGSLGALFAWSHVPVNLPRYGGWLIETQTPLVLLAFVAPLMLRGREDATGAAAGTRERRWLILMLLSLAAVVVAGYLPYVPFEDWTYLRFLLPALPAVIALSAAVVVRLVERMLRRRAAWAVAGIAAGLAVFGVATARDRHAFRLQAMEARFRIAGEHVGARLPPGGVVLTIWHSGSVRYYGDRLTVVWDALAAEELDGAITFLAARGRPPYLLLEAWEEPAFRARFADATPVGALDWPPVAQFGSSIRLYDPADRARYFAGGRIATDFRPLPASR